MVRILGLLLLVIAFSACAPADAAESAIAVSSGPTQPAVRILDLDVLRRATGAPSLNTPTLALLPTDTASPSASNSVSVTLPAPSSSAAKDPTLSTTAAACQDRAEFIRHLSVSPGTALLTGQWFAKIWRVRNAGDCIWSSAYTLRFLAGEMFTGPQSSPLTQPVLPGETIDLSINLTAPLIPGDFVGEWVIADPLGETVPMQSFESPRSPSLWVQVTVRATHEPKAEKPDGDACR